MITQNIVAGQKYAREYQYFLDCGAIKDNGDISHLNDLSAAIGY